MTRLAFNYPIQLGEPRPIPPDGTPVYYQGQVVGRVVSTIQDSINIEIDEQHREAVMQNFKDVSIGVKACPA